MRTSCLTLRRFDRGHTCTCTRRSGPGSLRAATGTSSFDVEQSRVIELAIALVLLVAGGGGAGVGLAWLNDRRHAARDRPVPPADAKAILDARFASGDIDEPEYTRRMHLLVYGPPLELDEPR